MTMITTTLSDPQRRALLVLAPHLDKDTYLAGGVAVGLTLGHRTSIDLDFFVPHDFDSERLAEQMLPLLPAASHARETGRARGTLHLEIEGVPVSILSYRYPLLAEPNRSETLLVSVASLEDLICMKLSAIAGRGAAKDFWDLDALLKHGVAAGSLAKAVELFGRKYPAVDTGHLVRSLAYFGEADDAPLPRGLGRAEWEALKERVRARVTLLS
jgi:hypothetical protein